MKKKTLVTLLLFVLLIAACGGDEEAESEEILDQSEAGQVEGEQAEVSRVVTEQIEVAEEAAAAQPPAAQATPDSGGAGAVPLPVVAQPEGRLIIKEAQMNLMVENTDMAVNRVTDIAVGAAGYILSQRVWDDDLGYRHATITLGVPVDRFERVLQQLRRLGEVTNEEASGDDVTEEYVDLDSRLESLRTTHERLLSFLEEAETVEEILALNQRISEVEGQLSQIQGRINYLSNRAAFSTVSVMLEPNVALPTPTPTVTPTATPTPTPWTPGDTARQASLRLEHTAQGILSFLIYYGIVCGPWLLLIAPLTYGGWRLVRRVETRDGPPPVTPDEE